MKGASTLWNTWLYKGYSYMGLGTLFCKARVCKWLHSVFIQVHSVPTFFGIRVAISCIITVAFSGLKCVHGCACMHPMITCEFRHISAEEVPVLRAYAPRCYSYMVIDANKPSHTRHVNLLMRCNNTLHDQWFISHFLKRFCWSGFTMVSPQAHNC